MKRSLIIILCTLVAQCAIAQQNECYVSLTGSDNNTGSISSPFATIYKAQQYVRDQVAKKSGGYQIILRGGIYTLTKPIIFDAKYDANPGSTVEFKAYTGEKVTISGGKTLSGTWVKTNNSSVWKLNLSSSLGSNAFFQSLFVNGKRLKRASSDTLFTKGPIPQFSKSYKIGTYDFTSIKRLVKDSLNVFCCFNYAGTDLDNLEDTNNAQVIVYNSWEASLHHLYRLDKTKKTLYLTNPLTYPIGFFSPRVRYMIINSMDYLNKPGEWVLDSKNSSLYYYAARGENPNQKQFIAPVLDTLITAKGDGQLNAFISNINFSNINFSYSKSAWGFNVIYFNLPNLAAAKAENSRLYPWMNLKDGFSGQQAALDCGGAISLLACKNWTFNNCSFTNLGNYAIAILQYSNNNTISNCSISDIGGGGIAIGYNRSGGKQPGIPADIIPSGNKVLNCTITNCGVIFPSGVGICVTQATHTLISRNTISNLPYSGISVGWTFGFQDNYTSYNTIQYNRIHDVMKILNDGGGIYTLGKQVGSVYRGNYIYNVYRSNNSIGAHSDGFFFDQGSSEMQLDSNVVYGVKNETLRYNQTDASKVKFGYNYFEKLNTNTELRKVISKKIQGE